MDLASQIKVDQTKDVQPGAGEIALDLGKSFVQSAVISPVWNGLGQLVSGGHLPQVSIANEANAKHSTADAWAQKIGGAAGMALDFCILAAALKGGFGEVAEASTARSLTLCESTMLRLGEGARVGAAYGAFFVPSAPGDNIAFGRLKNAASNGITFGALGGLSAVAGGIGVLGKMQPGTLAYAVKDIGVTGAVGLPSGAIGAEADSFINHGKKAEWKDIKSQAIDYGVIGLVFSGLTHGATGLSAMRSTSVALTPRADVPLVLDNSVPSPQAVRGIVSAGPTFDLRAEPATLDAGTKPVVAEPLPQGSKVSAASSVVDRGEPVSSQSHETMGGRFTRTVYADKTEVLDHYDDHIKLTTLPDQTRITETDNGVRTEYPDGSEVNVTSYRTERRSAEGKWTIENNHWTDAWENWGELKPDQKRAALTTLDQIPRGGNLAANIVAKGLGEADPALQELAVKGILHISDPGEQVNQWSLARNYNPQFEPELTDMLPRLSSGSRQRILSSHGASLGGVFSDLVAKSRGEGASDAEGKATAQYLDMVQDFNKTTRKSIWDQLNQSMDKDPHGYGDERLQPLARRIVSALGEGEPLAVKAFGEFADLDPARFKAIDKLQIDKPSRDDILVRPSETAEATFKQVQAILLGAENTPGVEAQVHAMDDAERQVAGILAQNPSLDLRKMVSDWSKAQDLPWIKDFIDRQMSPPKRYNELIDEYFRLTRADPLSDYHSHLAFESPFDLNKRAQTYYVNHAQIEATLQNTVQLMQIADANRGPDGELTRAGNQFRMAGLQTMAQAGDPFLVVQGAHPTCAMAQLELSTFLKHPDEASRMVNEIMRTGKFVTQDGTVISIDPTSLRPENSSLEMNRTREDVPNSGYRSYVSQIFQTAAANIYWQRQTIVPDGTGRVVPPGSLRYEIHFNDVRDKSNRIIGQKPSDALMDYSQTPPVKVADGPKVTDLDQLVDIGEQIGGSRTRPSVTMTIPDNEADFERYLASLPFPEAFPLILPIDARALKDPSKPFVGPNHAISILAPWQSGQRIYFHNTWFPGGLVDNNMERNRFWEITNQ